MKDSALFFEKAGIIKNHKGEWRNMAEDVMEIISLLDDKDRGKLYEFANMLIRREKYDHLRKEINARRAEIQNGEILSHDELWAGR